MYDDLALFLTLYADAIALDEGPRVQVKDAARLRNVVIDHLVDRAVFGDDDEKAVARWLIWEIAAKLGIYPETMHHLYTARGRGETPVRFTVPAINCRALTYDMARAAFAAAQNHGVGLILFEIARSEIGYTDQRPAEYTACILAGAIKSGYTGPVFLQADHLRVCPKRFKEDAEAEVRAVRSLVMEAVDAGFYNIELDTSTLVDSEGKSLDEQQYLNYRWCAELAAVIRERQPDGIEASIGGEIGEVGDHNSTEPELRAFMDGFNRALPKGLAGLCKISVQAGTSVGGVVLPDGSIANVAVDFDTLLHLSRVARQEYGMAGVVQHGASTLPEGAFHKFAENEVCEVHLATGFQNILYEHEAFPSELRWEMYAYLDEQFSGHRRAGMTDEQFYYQERRRALGPFKRALWSLEEEVRSQLRTAWRLQFEFLFEQLNVHDTLDLARRYAPTGPRHRPPADFRLPVVVQEDVRDLVD